MSELQEGTAGHTLIFADDLGNNLASAEPNEALTGADIAFGQPNVDQVMALDGLKWIHLSSAGYTRYDREDFWEALRARGTIMTSSSAVFAEPCAQHLLAFMLALARELPQAVLDQFGPHKWAYDDLRPRTRVLRDQVVLLVGFGAIAKRLAEMLVPFNMDLIGFRRKVRGDEPIATYEMDKLTSFLPSADHVVNMLPAAVSTNEAFGETQFLLMKGGAVFYNIGRGSTVSQSALDSALRTGRLSAAYLDVTEPEPLPPDHLLWTSPNCFITPHIGGGHGDETITLVRHFLENLRLYEADQPLKDRIV